jgi:glycerol uptake operon antiterminator
VTRISGDNKDAFLRLLATRPVVPAVRGSERALERALAGDYAAVFVLGGDPFRLVERLSRFPERPRVCVNLDLVGGLAADAPGVRFLAEHVEGVISTHRHIIEVARDAGLLTIQRLFAIDSVAVERGLKLIRKANPDLVEILPALAYPEIAGRYREILIQPVLAGGLLKTGASVGHILAAGAVGVSSSYEPLWDRTERPDEKLSNTSLDADPETR